MQNLKKNLKHFVILLQDENYNNFSFDKRHLRTTLQKFRTDDAGKKQPFRSTRTPSDDFAQDLYQFFGCLAGFYYWVCFLNQNC